MRWNFDPSILVLRSVSKNATESKGLWDPSDVGPCHDALDLRSGDLGTSRRNDHIGGQILSIMKASVKNSVSFQVVVARADCNPSVAKAQGVAVGC